MGDSRLMRAFLALWWVLGVVLLILSAESVWSSIQPGRVGGDIHGLVLGSIEGIAAILFLVPRAMRMGGLLLLVIFTVVFTLHLVSGHFAAPVLVYAAGVVFVMVHGPVAEPMHTRGTL